MAKERLFRIRIEFEEMLHNGMFESIKTESIMTNKIDFEKDFNEIVSRFSIFIKPIESNKKNYLEKIKWM